VQFQQHQFQIVARDVDSDDTVHVRVDEHMDSRLDTRDDCFAVGDAFTHTLLELLVICAQDLLPVPVHDRHTSTKIRVTSVPLVLKLCGIGAVTISNASHTHLRWNQYRCLWDCDIIDTLPDKSTTESVLRYRIVTSNKPKRVDLCSRVHST
jgi:hypothetical protein